MLIILIIKSNNNKKRQENSIDNKTNKNNKNDLVLFHLLQLLFLVKCIFIWNWIATYVLAVRDSNACQQYW